MNYEVKIVIPAENYSEFSIQLQKATEVINKMIICS